MRFFSNFLHGNSFDLEWVTRRVMTFFLRFHQKVCCEEQVMFDFVTVASVPSIEKDGRRTNGGRTGSATRAVLLTNKATVLRATFLTFLRPLLSPHPWILELTTKLDWNIPAQCCGCWAEMQLEGVATRSIFFSCGSCSCCSCATRQRSPSSESADVDAIFLCLTSPLGPSHLFHKPRKRSAAFARF